MATSTKKALIAHLRAEYERMTGHAPATTQVRAWEETWRVFSRAKHTLPAHIKQWGMVWEFELPREGGRRPDVLLVTDTHVVVLEIKTGTAGHPTAALDQVRAYVRDLAHYHEASHEMEVLGVLLPTAKLTDPVEIDGVHVMGPQSLIPWLQTIPGKAPDLARWLDAPYMPLPSLIEGARHAFAHEPLPRIKRAQHTRGVDQCYEALLEVTGRAHADRTRHLVLITGAPGAGKTLVGLQYVHHVPGNGLLSAPDAIYLTGNDPLVSVLQRALGRKSMVRPIRTFYKEHIERQRPLGAERRLVFDEAQRAWDSARMEDRYGAQGSAAQVLVRLGSEVEGPLVLVALVGQGQEIHLGEEEGLGLWGQAVREVEAQWVVHLAPAIEAEVDAPCVVADPRFNLDTSMRGHLSAEVASWADAVVQADLSRAQDLAQSLHEQGFTLRMSRDLDAIKTYCRARYAGQQTKRFGLVASSRARVLPDFGVPNSYMATSRLNVGAWYVDSPESLKSCCQLDRCVTEFACQGLELDLPVVCWGEDFRWEGDEWWASKRGKAKDPQRLRRNAYRVLLTRGRDGVVLFVPALAKLDETAAALARAGARPLEELMGPDDERVQIVSSGASPL